MTFEEVVDQATEMLQRRGRMTYRMLRQQFSLDEATLDDLKEELLFSHPQLRDEGGRGLIWSEGVEAGVAPAAERRQLTVMFCDLVGSTQLSSQLDPEELREVIQLYQQTAAEVIAQYDGYIAQYLGDGLLVYFGYPQAHEEDAHRAVRAGLDLLKAMDPLNTRLEQDKSIQLAIRVGIHTGLAVVGNIGGGDRQEQLALGETPNITARLEGVAQANQIVVSASTRRLLGQAFELEALGQPQLKGVSAPLRVYGVLRELVIESRFEASTLTALTPLVGRDEEIGLMLRRWEQVKSGEGQVVLLGGEAGIGKSRSVQAICERVADDAHTLMRFQCSPYHTNTAFYPITEQFALAAGFDREDTAEQKLDKLEAHLEAIGLDVTTVVPLFAATLSIPAGDRYPSLDISPQQLKEHTITALADRLLAAAEQSPILFIAEDLHWSDPTSLEVIGNIIERIQDARVFILCTHRPEFTSPWGMQSVVTTLSLNRLSRSQSASMTTKLTEGKPLPAEVLDQILVKSDGIPLFVEEVTKNLLESGWLAEKSDHYEVVGSLPSMAIPSTLQDALMARLDRLKESKEVAQIGAIIGREFSYDLVRAVTPFDETKLQAGLQQLVHAELCFQRGALPDSTYLFKHALIQDAAYQSLLFSTRQAYHHRIAEVLEHQFSEITENQPELLAHHYTEAGLANPAIPYWQRAGQRALERSANVEAEAHLTQGIELLETLPETPERAEQELTMQTTLGAALVATKGFASPEVLQTYARARELCQLAGETPQVFQVLRGLWYFYLLRSELQIALELGEELLTLAEQVDDSVLRVESHYALGLTLNYLGQFEEAHTHLTRGIELYDPQYHHIHAFSYGLDPGVACRAYGAANLWFLGYSEQALQWSHEAVALAEELEHPFSLGFSLFITSWIPQFRREVRQTRERADACVTLAAEHGFLVFGSGGTIFRGWALAEQSATAEDGQGSSENDIAEIQKGVTGWRATGAEALLPYYLALLAEAFGKRGEVEEGLSLLREGLEVSKGTGECRWDAELHRLMGELCLISAREDVAEAETRFQQALDIARHQQAKALELRVGMSLGRLWQRQGRHAEAQELLAPIYGWFTEGLDTADLQDAKALLDELSAANELVGE